jgi:CubicO group peptidase (beta-lactamase class C family)
MVARVLSAFLVLIMILGSSGPSPAQQDPAKTTVSWETLDKCIEQAEQDGLAGAILVVRNGEIVLHRGFGLANREKQIKNTKDTTFALGSTPIDFTKAGILLLADRGQLKLTDSIDKYFDDVPADKQTITIEHLMTGRSGLGDFHDRPQDKNKDHTWISRDEALRRIFEPELLFAPGTGREHSHSAFGVLAAVIEVVSGQSYQQFTREHLFAPLGLDDIGFFGESLSEDRVAVGYGFEKSSEPNSPPHWGKTSWLVMGSGGQVGTLQDNYAWVSALRAGKLLSPDSQQLYFGNGSNVYANGFEFMFNDGPDSMAFLISNNVDSRERRKYFDGLARRLMRLVRSETNGRQPQITRRQMNGKFSLGVALSVSSDEGTIVQQVMPDSAADRDGLQVDDQILKIGGVEVTDEPVALLDKYLQDGTPMPLTVLRDGKVLQLTVTPLAK